MTNPISITTCHQISPFLKYHVQTPGGNAHDSVPLDELFEAPTLIQTHGWLIDSLILVGSQLGGGLWTDHEGLYQRLANISSEEMTTCCTYRLRKAIIEGWNLNWILQPQYNLSKFLEKLPSFLFLKVLLVFFFVHPSKAKSLKAMELQLWNSWRLNPPNWSLLKDIDTPRNRTYSWFVNCTIAVAPYLLAPWTSIAAGASDFLIPNQSGSARFAAIAFTEGTRHPQSKAPQNQRGISPNYYTLIYSQLPVKCIVLEIAATGIVRRSYGNQTNDWIWLKPFKRYQSLNRRYVIRHHAKTLHRSWGSTVNRLV